MNQHIPVKEYQNAAEMIREAQQRRMRLMGAAPVKPRPVVAIVAKEEPKPEVIELDHDAHVWHWRMHLKSFGSPKRQYLKEMAEADGYSLAQVFSRSRKLKLCHDRQRYMWEIKSRWPETTYPELGRLFNKDHTTAIHAIKAHEARMGGNLDKRVKSKNPEPSSLQSGYTGVNWSRRFNRWYVALWHAGRRHHVGSFRDLETAIAARNKFFAEVKNAPSL